MDRIRDMGYAGLLAYRSEYGSKSDQELISGALDAATNVLNWIENDRITFRKNVQQPRRLTKLYFIQLEDFRKMPNDSTVMASVFRMGPRIGTLSNALPYTYNYISELQKLSEQLDRVVQAESLDSGRRAILGGQLNQIQQLERNALIVASVITNPDLNAWKDKSGSFVDSYVIDETQILKANRDLLKVIAESGKLGG